MKGVTMFKKSLLAGAVAAALLPGAGLAADSPHTLTGNVGLYSQYIFRGMTQTNGDPAIQGGFDYSHASGFYAGTWASNVSILKENASFGGGGPGVAPIINLGTYGGGGSMEWDFYGGYKWGFAPDWTLDIGTLYYFYPGDINAAVNPAFNPVTGAPVGVPKADTWEIYGGLSWKWLSAKFSYSLDNKTFGVLDSGGTYYIDLSAAYPIPDTKLTVIAHYGIQKYKGNDPRNAVVGGIQQSNDALFSYDDWKLGLTYALPKDFTVGFYYTDTSSANKLGYGSAVDCIPGGAGPCGAYPKDISKGTGTIFVSKTF
jgi:uncharacterized protein (TIGR02001 family)